MAKARSSPSWGYVFPQHLKVQHPYETLYKCRSVYLFYEKISEHSQTKKK